VSAARVDLVQLMIADIEQYSIKLRNFLTLNGIDSSQMNLSELITSITNLKTKLNDRKYVALLFDQNGYVVETLPMDEFVELSKVPYDSAYGYYKFENNEFVLDEERQRQLEEV
jgi:hypothetical protein